MRKTKWSALLIVLLCIFMSTSSFAGSLANARYVRSSEPQATEEKPNPQQLDSGEQNDSGGNAPGIQKQEEPVRRASFASVSTFAQLKEALEDVAVTEIAITDDIEFTQMISISRNVTIMSAFGSDVTLSFGGGRHFRIQGNADELTLDHIVLDGKGTNGGIIALVGNFTLTGGTIQNCKQETGGAVQASGNLTVKDSILQDNQATQGGALYSNSITIQPETLIKNNAAIQGGGAYSTSDVMIGGVMEYNTATQGGAVFANNFELQGGTLRHNSAQRGGAVFATYFKAYRFGVITKNTADYGGGVYASSFDMMGLPGEQGFQLTDNTAMQNGGGAYITDLGTFYYGNISGNTAKEGNGGGIYIPDVADLQVVSSEFTFSNNKAKVAYEIAESDKALHDSKIKTSQFTQPFAYGYNNLDISYTGGTPIVSDVTVTYHANAGDDTKSIKSVEPGAYTLESIASLGFAKTDHLFSGWAITADGEVIYSDEENITLEDHIDLYAVWEKEIYYAVIFDTDGGFPVPEVQQVKEGNKVVKPANPSKNGYTFAGWWTLDPVSGAMFQWDFNNSLNTDITLFARYEIIPMPVIVQFDTQGGAPNVGPVIGYTGTLLAAPTTNPVKDGTVFDGWYTQATGGNKWNFDTDIVTDSMTLYAQYVIPMVPVIVQFDTQGGTPNVAPIIAYTGLTIDKPTIEPAKADYAFDGWYTQAQGGNKWDFENDIVLDGMTLYAQYKQSKVTVTFDTQGGVPVPEVQTIAPGEKAIEPAAPTKLGHVFVGWFNRQSGGSFWDFDQAINEDTTVYAQYLFIPIPVKVSFDTQGGTPVPADTIVTTGDKLTAPAENPAITGHHFIGWFTESEGGDQWNFDNDIVMAEMTLYAQYQIKDYTISFDSLGGTPAPSSVIAQHGKTISQPGNPLKIGYTFKGWMTEDDVLWNFDSDTVTSDMTLYAQWKLNNYVVVFDFGYDGLSSSQVVDYNELVTLPAPPKRAGYTLVEWQLENGTVWDFDTMVMPDNHITLFAVWKINQYTVTFQANGGTPQPAAQTVDFGSKVTQPADMTRPGYTFKGWYQQDSIEWNFATNTVPAENITLFAMWSANTYTVTFDSQGGSVVDPVQVKCDAKIPQPVNPTKTGYTFAGWYTATTGGNQWNFGAGTMPANNMTLFARWNVNSYNVSFHPNGGSPAPDMQSVVFGGKISVPTTPVRNGFIFKGWYTSQNGGTKWNFDTMTMPAEYLILYAQWDQQYTLTYHANGGTPNKTETITSGVPFAVKSASALGITRTENVFFGWATTSTGNAVYQPGATITPSGNMTLYAVWKSPYFSNQAEMVKALAEPSFGTIYAKANFTMTDVVTINRNVTIQSNSTANRKLTAATGKRHFNVTGSTISVNFTNIILAGGNVQGGINSTASTLNLTGPIIENCKAANGGGIYATGNLAVNNCTIRNNAATYGGGIYCSGKLTLVGGSITGNTASSHGAGVYLGGTGASSMTTTNITSNVASSYGGGIYLNTGAAFTMNGTGSISSNAAKRGGGIYSNGGTLTLTKGNINSNTSSTYGGGIAATSSSTLSSAANMVFNYNKATTYGGAIYTEKAMTVTSSKFTGNKATHGGAIYTNKELHVNGAQFTSNETTIYGGAIFGTASPLHIYGSSKFSKNVSQDGGCISTNSGAINVYGTTNFDSNTANGTGGAIHSHTGKLQAYGSVVFNNNKAGWGGGAYCLGDASLTLYGSVSFTNNRADVHGGVLYIAGNGTTTVKENVKMKNNSAQTYGGAIYTNADTTTVTVNVEGNAEISGNTAGAGAGIGVFKGAKINVFGSAVISGNVAREDGGGMFVRNDGNGTFKVYGKATIKSNKAGSNHPGGGIYLGSGSLTINGDAVLSHNSAYNGGAIATRGTTTIGGNALIQSNTAANDAGGVIVNIATLTISDSARIINNLSNRGGGLVACERATANLQGSAKISNNTANEFGGGVMMYGTSPKLNVSGSAQINENKTYGNGGGIHYSGSGASVSLGSSSQVRNNTASKTGGGIYRRNDANAPSGTGVVINNNPNNTASGAGN